MQTINFPVHHCLSVAANAHALSKEIGLSDSRATAVTVSALLHDLGKIAVPSRVLHKPGPLDVREWSMIHIHPALGAQIVRTSSAFSSLASYILHHHERWDGSGYPMGLKGDEIPLPSQIIAVTDAFHAMMTDRPYQRARSLEDTVANLESGAGSLWNERLVAAQLAIVRRDLKFGSRNASWWQESAGALLVGFMATLTEADGISFPGRLLDELKRIVRCILQKLGSKGTMLFPRSRSEKVP